MKNLKSYILFISVPFIILIFILQAYILNLQNQRNMDYLFVNALSNSYLGFGMNYNIMSDEEKTYYYIEIASNLKVANSLILKTSYKNNKYLYASINNMYLCMTKNESRKLIFNKKDEIYHLLISLSENPSNIENAKKLQLIIENNY